MDNMENPESLLKKAEEPYRTALVLHAKYEGKVQVGLKVPIKELSDFSIWYTPGVAAPCREIANNRYNVFKYTNKGNTVAIVTDGTRVLGLGNVGPEAALPVMEGKSLLFKYLGGVDAYPLCINTTDMNDIFSFCKWLAPSVSGINLEDIESPKCFRLLERLQTELDIPVFHDDQQGTAVVVLAGLINSLRIVGKEFDEIKVSLIGFGAANTAIFKLLTRAGVKPGNIVICDINGILNKDDAVIFGDNDPRAEMVKLSNDEGKQGNIAEALNGADICVAFSRSGPGIIKPDWVRSMARDAVVFLGANPIPEMWPWEAKESGARIVATGRSDFPNQINNSLGFPGIFRGALDVGATRITDEMCIVAAHAIADFALAKGLSEEYIIPTMNEYKLYAEVAFAVAERALKQQVAALRLSTAELRRKIEKRLEMCTFMER